MIGKTHRACELEAPTRNRYFHGKLLDTYHFELETSYHNAKRHLINRLVVGHGVVCGLDVVPDPEDPCGVRITPGVAIDRWGREIVVAEPSAPLALLPHAGGHDDADHDAAAERVRDERVRDDRGREQRGRDPKGRGDGDSEWVHLLLCYHECETDPAPVLAGDCCPPQQCHASSVQERYRIEVRSGRCRPRGREALPVPDVIENCRIDYDELARIISSPCPPCPDDPCIPLASVEICHCRLGDIDIGVRPIVFGNDLLLHLIRSLLKDSPDYRNAK